MVGSLSLKLYGHASLVLVGVLWNIFNLTNTILEQLRSGGVRTVAAIICSISLCNILLHVSTLLFMTSVWLGAPCWTDLPALQGLAFFIWLCSCCTSFWSVACLSLFYWVKVVNFSSPLLRGIKRNISAIVGTILALTLTTSCLLFSPFFFLRTMEVNKTLTADTLQNTTRATAPLVLPLWLDVTVYMSVFVCHMALLPLALMLPTSLWLVVFLSRHTMSLQKNHNAPSGVSSYLLVSRLTVALVGVYVTTMLIISLYYLYTFLASIRAQEVLFLCLSFYCIASAVLLTASNRRLRERLRGLFCNTEPPNSSAAAARGRRRGDASV